MFFLSENLKKYRIMKSFTQEQIADYLGVTAQSVSKWERGECYPDITLLPALANIYETSVDLLLGMDTIRANETVRNIHKRASEYQHERNYIAAENVYRKALLFYPNNSGMILGLAGVLALRGKSQEAIEFIERGLPLSSNEKQKATMRAILCFLYLKCGNKDKASALASALPHKRESREVVQPLIENVIHESEIDLYIRNILIGDE